MGQNLYEHSNVIEIKNNILLIEADHPGWIQMFHMNKKYILNGLKMFVPELNIVSLAFRLKGSNATLTNVRYDAEFKKESSKMKENLEKDEKKISEFDKNRKKTESISSSLPNELLSKFKEMENTALSRK